MKYRKQKHHKKQEDRIIWELIKKIMTEKKISFLKKQNRRNVKVETE